MELVVINNELEEEKILDKFSLDIDLADDKSFSIVTEKKSALDFGLNYMWYIPDTEYGGIIDTITVKTDTGRNDSVTYAGRSWRGFLNGFVYDFGRFEFSAGITYEEVLDSITKFLNIDDIVEIDKDFKERVLEKDYSSKLYPTFYEFLTDFAAHSGQVLRLKMKKKKKLKIRIGFADITTHSNLYVAENSFYFEAKTTFGGVNHLICLGSGEYPKRTIVNLYVNRNGEIDDFHQTFYGKEERAEIYDYPNAESKEDLTANGIEKLKELREQAQITLSVADNNYNIGDKVCAYEELTGLTIESEISSIIFRLETSALGESSNVEYTIKKSEE